VHGRDQRLWVGEDMRMRQLDSSGVRVMTAAHVDFRKIVIEKQE
jgi:hypothetical protein